jgi:uncharacterized protein (TIGR03435 family)
MRRTTRLVFLSFTAFVLTAGPPALNGQAPADQKPLVFEAASIKRNRSGDDVAEGGFQPGGRINARNVSLFNLMTAAYATFKIDGGPAWTRSDRFDVVAVGDRNASVADTRQMLQALLAERFKLVIRTESRDEPIFNLALVRQDRRLGPQLKPASDCSDATRRENLPPATAPPDLNHPVCGVIAFGGGLYRGHGVTLDQIAASLAQPVDRVVKNRTALQGIYDYELRFSRPNETPNPNDPPEIVTAVREQLGVRLQAARGGVEFIVIVSAQQPQVDE